MKLSNRTLVIIFAFLIILSVLAILIGNSKTYETKIATIYKDGVLVQKIDLNAVESPYIIEVGTGNEVLVEKGRISMYSADCPDKLCVKQGAITNGMYPIVCLPNRVVISIEEGDEDIDAVSGK
ncbi:MAG: NusG domain II-containing protein [Eubacteriales bacterium]